MTIYSVMLISLNSMTPGNEWVINSLSWDSRHRGPYNPCNHNLTLEALSSLTWLAPGRCASNVKCAIYTLISWIDILSISHETALMSMSQNPIDDRSSLVQVITRANVDPDLCRHMASSGHNKLTHCVPQIKYVICTYNSKYFNSYWLWNGKATLVSVF